LEVETVRQIYELFVVQSKTEREIMENLNGRRGFGEFGRPWTGASVHQVLINPKYIGANVYNRRSFKLKYKRVKNPVQMWIWRDGAFEPLISAELFAQAREIIETRQRHLSDEELLERLRELLRAQGRLSGILIDETEDMPSSACYSSRIGSLNRACQGQSKRKPMWRSKREPLLSVGVVVFGGEGALERSGRGPSLPRRRSGAIGRRVDSFCGGFA
jgi:hypothetical protein